MKKTNLTEKPSRIPDISEVQITQKFKEYIEQISQVNTESAKAQRFLILLKDVFGDVNAGFIEDYLHGVEKYVSVKQKDIILRGRIDTLYGNLIIEFENDLRKRLDDALGQLQRYVSCLLQSGEKATYLCLATDGILFNVYSPKIKSIDEIELEVIDKIDLTKTEPYQAYFYLDRYFFRKIQLHPKTEEIVRDFGIKSPAFKYCLNVFDRIWSAIKSRSDFKVIYDNWEKYLRVTYGSLIGSEELFLRHSYLAVFTKLIVWMRLSESSSVPSSETIIKVLDGDFFSEQGIDNFLEEDFFSWIVREQTKETALDVSRKLINQLANYNLRELSEDILKSLYQELVDPETRHDLGEYYTPDWLADYVDLIKMCSDPEDEDLINSAIRDFWTETLKMSHPTGKAKFDSIEPDDWHENFLSIISNVSDPIPIFRHIGEEKNLVYKKVSEIDDEERKRFIEEINLPGNKIGRFKDDAFNKAVEKVIEVWQKLFVDIEPTNPDNCTSYIKNWNLDTGVDEDGIYFWA
jgi:hypothetical protein